MLTKKEYNIGLDIGTNSVGWSVVETNNQKVMRKGNKALWGVRLFDKAESAELRRMQRSTRRRYDRRRERIRLLQEEFRKEIDKVDKTFFEKLQESKYQEKDRTNKSIVLTNEEKKLLKDYQNKYKTIYHLREELITNPEKKDIRLVYLAIHHIIKYRGNFLYQNSNFNINNLDIKEQLKTIFTLLFNNIQALGIPEDYLQMIDFDKIERDLLNNSKNDVKKLLQDDLEDIVNRNFAIEFGKLMVGNNCNLKKMLLLESDNKIDISLSGNDYDDKYTII